MALPFPAQAVNGQAFATRFFLIKSSKKELKQFAQSLTQSANIQKKLCMLINPFTFVQKLFHSLNLTVLSGYKIRTV